MKIIIYKKEGLLPEKIGSEGHYCPSLR